MKKLTVMILALAMLAAFAQTNMANPVTEYASLDEINSIAGTNLVHPAVMGVSEETFSTITVPEGVISQYGFTVAGFGYTFRGARMSGDISGVYVNGREVYPGEASYECDFFYGDGFMLSRWKNDSAQYTLYVEDPDGIMDKETFRLISWEMQELVGTGSYEMISAYDESGLAGNYQDKFSQRAWAEIRQENGRYVMEIHWADSASEYYRWTMTLEPSGEKLIYSDCVCCSVTTLDDGTERLITIYDDASGFFTVSGSGLKWNGAENDYCRDCVFVKAE
ncbi:MAG: hypothetical protein IKV51_07540 [Clostridia bacterium]|nr:hypothetical protein [Clostridia bacterium]